MTARPSRISEYRGGLSVAKEKKKKNATLQKNAERPPLRKRTNSTADKVESMRPISRDGLEGERSRGPSILPTRVVRNEANDGHIKDRGPFEPAFKLQKEKINFDREVTHQSNLSAFICLQGHNDSHLK